MPVIMPSFLLHARALAALAASVALVSCVETSESPTDAPEEEVAVVRQEVPSPCTRDLAGVGAIAAGWHGIRTDGSVWLPQPAGGSSEKYNALGNDNVLLGDIDGESTFQCVVKTGGEVHCWGPNGHGNLGRGFTSVDEPVPAPVIGLPGPAKYVALGIESTCALLEDGRVFCWGGNEYGQIGNGQVGADVLTPVHVASLGSGVDEVSVGYWHACARKGGTISCWGHNLYGEVGAGFFSPTGDVAVPDPVAVSGTYAHLSAGGFFTCGISPTGTLSCWGDNFWGQMGIAGNQSNRNVPTLVPNIGPVSKVDTAVHSACAVRTNGSLWCWGNEENGRLGNGGTNAAARTPAGPVTGPLGTGGVADIRLTEGAVCAITTDGRTYCFGAGGFIDGQGATAVPVEVDFCGLPTLEMVSPGLGPIGGGNQVTLTGTEFVAGARVFFDTVEATAVTVNGPTSIVATAPNKGFGAVVDVVVELPGQKRARVLGGYEYADGPRLSGVMPFSGPTAGGETVTLSGSYFRPGATLTFGGSPATNVNVTALNQMTAVTPPHAGGVVDVVLTNPDGQTDTLEMGYRYVAGVDVVSIDPTSGPAGTRVTVTGDGFDFDTVVKFDGVDGLSFTYLDAQHVGVVAPAHALGTVDITVVRMDGQSFNLPMAFTYTEGGPGTGGNGAGGEDGGADGPGGDCYCRAGAPVSSSGSWALVGLAVALAYARRRGRM